MVLANVDAAKATNALNYVIERNQTTLKLAKNDDMVAKLTALAARDPANAVRVKSINEMIKTMDAPIAAGEKVVQANVQQLGTPLRVGLVDPERVNTLYSQVAGERLELLKAQQALSHFGSDIDQLISSYTTQFNSLRDQSYFGNLQGEVAGFGRVSCTVPDPTKPFSMNIPRSAFVSRTTTLVIENGVLLGFSHDKPSEIEGFTTIPLTLSEKLAGLPRALFEAKNTSIQGNDTVVKSQTQLVNDQQSLQQAITAAKAAAVKKTTKP
jgi:hypothetical protein